MSEEITVNIDNVNQLINVLKNDDEMGVMRINGILYLDKRNISRIQSPFIKIITQTILFLQKTTQMQMSVIKLISQFFEQGGYTEDENEDNELENAYDELLYNLDDLDFIAEEPSLPDDNVQKFILQEYTVLYSLILQNEDFTKTWFTSPYSKRTNETFIYTLDRAQYFSSHCKTQRSHYKNFECMNQLLKHSNTILKIDRFEHIFNNHTWSSSILDLTKQIQIRHLKCHYESYSEVVINNNNNLNLESLEIDDLSSKIKVLSPINVTIFNIKSYEKRDNIREKLESIKSREYIINLDGSIQPFYYYYFLNVNILIRVCQLKNQYTLKKNELLEIDAVNCKYSDTLRIIAFNKIFESYFSIYRVLYDLYEYDFEKTSFSKIKDIEDINQYYQLYNYQRK